MAKLSAKVNGQEVYRLRKKEAATEETIESYREVSIRSTRRVLSKTTVRFKPDEFYPKGRLHSYGWHGVGTIAQKLTLEDQRDKYLKVGFDLVK